MGWLHDGHRELIRRARSDNATTVVSIFVNPRQFNEAADYTKYPRNEERDLAMCADEGVDLVFAPGRGDLSAGFRHGRVGGRGRPAARGNCSARPLRRRRDRRRDPLQPRRRGAGVIGQKDAQQVMVIRQMARDLAIGAAVLACPTVREADGLALSSRNVHLSPEERRAAGAVRRALLAARSSWEGGERSGDALRAAMRAELDREPLAAVEYVSIADGSTLAELDMVQGPALASLAVRFGSTRLIDNEPLG